MFIINKSLVWNLGKTMLSYLALAISWPTVSATGAGGSDGAAMLAVSNKPMDQEFRLATVGYRLGLANSTRCDNAVMLTALILHNIGGYAPNDRAAASEAYGLTSCFGVLHVVQRSAADLARHP